MKFSTPYDRLPHTEIDVANDKTGADQSFKDEADINYIMRRYATTGYLTDPNKRPTRVPRSGDFTTSQVDFLEAQNTVLRVQATFNSLPAALRRELNNDPGELLNWLANPANNDQAAQLGLITPAPQPAPETTQAPSQGDAEPRPSPEP